MPASSLFVRFLSFGVGAVLLGLSAAGPAAAQNPQSQSGPPSRAFIDVSPADNACTYQIRNQENQDRFTLRPRGVLRVQARGGLWVDVTVEDDPQRGIPGTRGGRTVVLRGAAGGGAARDSLVARSPVGEPTEHRVHVQCCLEESREPGQGRECRRWADAQPPAMSTGALRPGVLLPPGRAAEARGPSAPSDPGTAPEPLPPGGPTMEVDE